MAFTQSDVDKIKAAIASGTDQVSYSDGRSIRYRSVADLEKALALATAEVSQTAGTATTVSYPSYSKF